MIKVRPGQVWRTYDKRYLVTEIHIRGTGTIVADLMSLDLRDDDRLMWLNEDFTSPGWGTTWNYVGGMRELLDLAEAKLAGVKP